MLTAGQLTQRVTIQAPPTAVDALGQAGGAWTDVATVWAQAQPLRGRELLAADAMQLPATVRFRVRWRAGVTGQHRLLWRGEAYRLVSDPIDVDGGRHTLELMCAGVSA